MLKFYINKEVAIVSSNSTILEACSSLGFEIPWFCFHEQLSVAGNCRMCLVELAKAQKLVVSCSTPVIKNM
jgi:NADH dehydrogenase/NADH:ubiquinone oxidoreductase subunit G